MGDIHTRPFSTNYSGLSNQTVIAAGIAVLAISSQEYMKRKRRGKNHGEGLGSRESWQFGYLFQGRSWARIPSPPSPAGWPLSWVKQILGVTEEEMLRLRGIDATLYVRFLRGCFWYALLHTLTTFPVLFPIHVRFSEEDVSPKSMQRASISSLVETGTGQRLLWIHVCLLFWVTISWIGTLIWVCHGVFRMRAKQIQDKAERLSAPQREKYYPHPHPQYAFLEDPTSQPRVVEGIRLRTVMVSNVPPSLRNEKTLREYFEYYMSRKLDKPSVGLTSSVQPGFLNKSFAFLFNRAKRLPSHLPTPFKVAPPSGSESDQDRKSSRFSQSAPVIDRVVIVRKMTELAGLLERREDILRRLETSHLKLAQRALLAVNEAVNRRKEQLPIFRPSHTAEIVAKARMNSSNPDVEGCAEANDKVVGEQMLEQLIDELGPFVEEFEVSPPPSVSRNVFRKLRLQGSEDSNSGQETQAYPPSSSDSHTHNSSKTIWEVLLSLPRRALDPYQPLVNLRTYFNDKLVPSIDYYTVKLNYTTSLIVEQRARALDEFPATSTAFVTFADPKDARKACQYLAVHPSNPLACTVTMAPSYSDLDWHRLMKTSFEAEFIKDWVVNMGVWVFTIFWVFPVSLFVGLVSIQKIGSFWPGLKNYLERHKWESEVIQSFVPTVLVALLALLIPLLLLLIAKKAHTITTLSALHDLILTRYYKFLIVNVLVIFCVGLASLQTVLNSFKNPAKLSLISIISESFPSAGPFYVGWMIFTTAMHAGVELGLFGLPLIMYPSTKAQVTPRKRTTGLRPRTLNFYYWLPNHLLVIHILLLFAVLNPFVLPFGMIYFFINSGVIKNQLIHVYAKNYEQNGQVLLIRMVRYSLDGAILSQVVFTAYMSVVKRPVSVGLSALMVVLTALSKLLLTRVCRAQFEHDDIREAELTCPRNPEDVIEEGRSSAEDSQRLIDHSRPRATLWRVKFPEWINSSYATIKRRPRESPRPPNPFSPQTTTFTRIDSALSDLGEPKSSPTRPGPTSPPRRSVRAMSGASRMSSVFENSIWFSPVQSVTAHPKPIPWDDEPLYDLPYDNPYYTREITNALWLPRNPFGILNLDDTVDVKMSLTTTTSKGELGHWQEPVIVHASPASTPMSLPSSDGVEHSLSSSSRSRFNGDEEIVLPPVIAQRARSNNDDNVERQPTRKPSIFLRAPTGTWSSRRTSGPRPKSSFRSFSASSGPRARSMSLLSAAPMSMDRVRSADHELGVRHSALSPEPMDVQVGGRSPNITAHDAIVHEVMAEEDCIQAEEHEREAVEAVAKTTTRSWLTSWMFKKNRDTGSTENLVR